MGSEPKRYSIFLKPAAGAALAGLSKKDQGLVAKKIDSLATNPRPKGSEKIKSGDELYRIRSGDYRVIYRIDDDGPRVLVVTIGHRKVVYRGM